MKPGRRTGRALAAVLMLVMGVSGPGCSYAMVQGPSRIRASEDGAEPVMSGLGCTTDSAAPTLDTIGGVSMILATVLGAAATVSSVSGDCKMVCVNTATAVGFTVGAAALATLFVASASTGNDRIADCRRAQEPVRRPHRTGRYVLDEIGRAHV